MKKIRDNRLFKVLSNKWLIATLIFLIWIIFGDENSIIAHTENKQHLQDLIQHKKYFKERIASDKQKLEDLSRGKAELEKFAREQYYMSMPDEDVFIVVEEEK